MDYRQRIEPPLLSQVIVGIFGLQEQPAPTASPAHGSLLAGESQQEKEPAVATA